MSPDQNPAEIHCLDESCWLEHLPGFLCLKDKDGHWLRASRNYLLVFNLQDADYLGKTDDELAQYPLSDARALKLSAIQDKSAWHLGRPVKETRIIAGPDMNNGILEITRTPVFGVGQNRLKLVVTGRFADQGEKPESDGLANTLQVCHLNVAFLDANFRISGVNNAFSLLTGYLVDDIENKPLSFMIEGGFELTHRDFINAGNGYFWTGELLCRHKNGQLFPVKLDITGIAKDNQDSSYFATLLDITRQKQSEKRIMQIAHFDDLTGLANRTMFFDRLNQFISESKHRQLHAVVFCINLDRFKAVNDSLGHGAGNQLLKEAAVRLRSLMGNRDVVARLGGDEFALLISNEKAHEQTMYSASLIAGEVLHKLSETFDVNKREVFIGASIGIAIYPEDGSSAEMLLKNANIAMYEAKRQGRNNYQFYNMDHADAAQDRLLMEFNLRKAMEKNELRLYYQPQYYAASRKIFGAEVLIRWFHATDGETKMIPPDKFIWIAEETGLIVEMGAWVMRTACLQLKKWLDEGYGLRQVSINVSARQFIDDQFLKTVEDALDGAQLNGGNLELELTESQLIGDIKQIELQLHRLKKMGIKIALDDFGTGYSSLSYLKNLPIDVLKIDQSFIREMTMGSKDARLAATIIQMGHLLGQKIIAEGVETEQQLMYLTHRGCDIIQGYYFSQPLPVHKMTALLVSEAQTGIEESKTETLFEPKF
ncbi:MAG: EAL domain-containing protein [Methylovulum sp.]|nr:EAL domain-containing protein [Methylovulum sp.]